MNSDQDILEVVIGIAKSGLGILAMLASILAGIAAFRKYKLAIAVALGFVSAFAGGLFWQLFCSRNICSSYYDGAALHGICAAFWAIVTMLPVVLSAFVVVDIEALGSRRETLAWCRKRLPLVALVLVFFAAASVAFYGFSSDFSLWHGIRPLFEGLGLAKRNAEYLIGASWGFVMCLPLFLLFRKGRGSTFLRLAAVFSPIVAVCTGLYLYNKVTPPRIDPSEAIRGIFTAPALRFSVFVAILVLLDGSIVSVVKEIRSWWRER